MNDQIDQVIAELSKIDAAADTLIASTESEKEAYKEEINNKIHLFDEELDKTTADELMKFKLSLQEASDDELSKYQTETTKTIADLDVWYEKNHTAIASQILNNLIKE